MESTTNHLAIQLRRLWERAKELQRPFDILAELETVRRSPPLCSAEVSELERWAVEKG